MAGRALAAPAALSLAGPPVLRAVAPDAARTARFWSLFLPIYLRYRWTKWRYQEIKGCAPEDVEAAWEATHVWGAPRVHGMLLDLSGYYVKSAQVLASKGDFIPTQWVKVLGEMFDAMPPRRWPAVEADVVAGLAACPLGAARTAAGLPPLTPSSVFSHLDPTPLAAASIAQVHAATLAPPTLADLGWRWAGGPRVVVKVQNQRMRALMDSDVRNLARLAAFVDDFMPFDAVGVSRNREFFFSLVFFVVRL